MPQENVAVVRQALDAWNRGDLEALGEVYDPGIELDFSNFAGWVEQKTYRGRDEVLSFLAQWLAIWDGYEQILDDVLAASDKVVALARQRASGHESGAATEMIFAQVCTLRDGKIVRIENHSDRGEALEAAGLPRRDM